MSKSSFIALLCAVVLSACATTSNVSLSKAPSAAVVSSAALVPADGNSTQMDGYIQESLTAQGLRVDPALPANANKTETSDLIVSYVDAWHWDIVMYMRYLNIYFYDGKTGDLVLTGNWQNSTLHSFPNAQKVVKELMAEMMGKLRSVTKVASVSK